MATEATVIKYKCPCCDAGLTFGHAQQKLTCSSCGNDFEIDAVKEYNRIPEDDSFAWESGEEAKWEENGDPQPFQCPSCGGLIEHDDHTASTFCPYCDNPVVLPTRVVGALKPDAVIPFKTDKKDAQNAFRQLCKGKLLLPKDFMAAHSVDKITGYYVPFWLYSCDGATDGKYRATRVRTWSDSNYIYTKTDYFLLTRCAKAKFDRIPMDGSTKMDNSIMESIEPFDYGQLIDFDPAYLAGFFSDKYDVPAKSGEARIRQRVNTTMDEMIAASCIGYSSVIPTAKNLSIQHSKAKYVLLPVWMMTTKYKDKNYTFAMNGQSGKMTGEFPICPKKSAAWFLGIMAAAVAVATAVQLLIL